MIRQALLADLRLAAGDAATGAEVGVALCKLKGVKTAKASWFNAPAETLRRIEAIQVVNPRTAKTFLKLRDEERLPSWVVSCCDYDLMQAAGSGDDF